MGKPLPNDYGTFSINRAALIASILWRSRSTICNHIINFITVKTARFMLTKGDDEIVKTDNATKEKLRNGRNVDFIAHCFVGCLNDFRLV